MIDFYGEALMRMSAAFTTIYLVALGHSLFELSGVLDLSIDGVFFLSTGLAVLFSAQLHTSLTTLGVDPLICTTLASVLTGLVTALIGLFLAFILTVLPISHGAVGLSLMFLGYGLGIYAGYPVRLKYGSIAQFAYPENIVVYSSILLVSLALGLTTYRMLYSTAIGAMIRACGEDPHAASALGVVVYRTRLIACGLGYFIVGVGGSIFTLLWLRYWDIRSYVLGYGWFAYTIALAAGRHPLILIPFAAVFGALLEFNISIQATYGLPVDLAGMIPFIAAIALMTLYGSTKLKRLFEPPRGLGKIYYKEERTI